MKRFLLAVAALVAIGSATAVAYADGEWLRSGPVWLRGLVYTGTSKVALTNAAGNLTTTSGVFSGNVGITGTLAVTGATTMVGNLTAPTGTFSGNLAVTGTSTLTGGLLLGAPTGITAGTTQTQAGATLMTGNIAFVTNGNANDGVSLPAAVSGKCVFVKNKSASNAMKLYGVSPAKVNNVTTTTGAIIAAFTGVICCSDGTDWWCTGTSS